MEGKILGIPLILIVFAVLIAAFINVPAFVMYKTNQNRFDRLEMEVKASKVSVAPTVAPASVVVSSTPTKEPTPSVKVTGKSATQSGGTR